jgi:transcription elongation factor Elf1
MIAFKHFFIDFAKSDFTCPHCKKIHDDIDLKYLDKINRNKSWITKVNCDCGQSFKLTINYKGDFETFIK